MPNNYFSPKSITHGLIAVRVNNLGHEEGNMLEVIHFTGYQQAPTENDRFNLKVELLTDPEFSIDVPFEIIEAGPGIVEYFKRGLPDGIE